MSDNGNQMHSQQIIETKLKRYVKTDMTVGPISLTHKNGRLNVYIGIDYDKPELTFDSLHLLEIELIKKLYINPNMINDVKIIGEAIDDLRVFAVRTYTESKK